MSTITPPTDVFLDLYTLDELAARAGMAPAALRRLDRRHPGRVPTTGDDPVRRYPPAAVEAFRRLAREEEEGGAAAHRRPLLSLTAQLRGPRRGPDSGREAPPVSQSAEAATAAASAAGRRAPVPEVAREVGAGAPRPPEPTGEGAERDGGAASHALSATGQRGGAPPAAAPGHDQLRTARVADPAPPGAPTAAAATGLAAATTVAPRSVGPATAAAAAPGTPRRLRPAAPARRSRHGTPAPAASARAPARIPSGLEVTARLAALEASQHRLEADIREALAALREPLHGSVTEI